MRLFGKLIGVAVTAALAAGAVYIYNSIVVYNTEGNPSATHGYNWGHYVRCIRR